ncbi:glycerophosphodiester phosphodiesterase [Micropruina sp.]|uniref:glycerophosphodiester phosphodiesterase n=1 Tax=Micropruina sp. TaxID=2737536 RepID=UPI0039E45A1E
MPADLPNPPILAHRGGFERHQLETLQAMEDAARRGFAIETDVRYTSDGVAVLVHDEAATKGLDCGDKEVQVSKTTWADLREQCRSKPVAGDDKRYQIPTLDATLEAIAAASPTAWAFLEIKTDESEAKLKALLATPAKYGLSERTVWTAFSRDRLARTATVDKDSRRMLFVSKQVVKASTIAKDGLRGVAVEHSIASAEYVKSLQAAGLRVVLWTVNDAAAWAEVTTWGAELLMTDTPEKYQQWLANR